MKRGLQKRRSGAFQTAVASSANGRPPFLVKNRRRLLRGVIFIALTLAAIWMALPKPPLLEGIDFSTRVRDRNGEVLRVTLTADQKYRVWMPLKEISPALIQATLKYEDKYYETHPGVNPVALLRAAWN